MYLLNAETELAWVLGPTPNAVLLADLDLAIIDPRGVTTYLTAPIDPLRFQAPTSSLEGLVTYLFTPTKEGHYKVRLVTGTVENHTILSKFELYVFDNTTIVNPIFYRINQTPDEKSLSQPDVITPHTGKLRWYPTRAIMLREITGSIGTPSVGSSIIVDVLKNGASLLSSPITIATGAFQGNSVIPQETNLQIGDYITVNVLQVGSTVPGSDLVVTFKYD